MECSIWIFKWRHLVGRFRTNAGSVIWPKLEPMKCLTWIFLSSEFACFVAGEIIQVREAMPGSVVPLAMFLSHFHFHFLTFIFSLSLSLFHFHLTSTWNIYITVSNLVMICYHLNIWPPDDTTCASCKVGHLMAPLALVTKLTTRWRHLHWFLIWPPDGANCISCKFAHQMAPQRTRFF